MTDTQIIERLYANFSPELARYLASTLNSRSLTRLINTIEVETESNVNDISIEERNRSIILFTCISSQTVKPIDPVWFTVNIIRLLDRNYTDRPIRKPV